MENYGEIGISYLWKFGFEDRLKSNVETVILHRDEFVLLEIELHFSI